MEAKFFTVLVNLKGSEEEVFQSFTRHTRKSVRKGLREEAFVEESQDIKDFYKRYLAFYKKKKLTPINFQEMEKETIALFICKHKNKIVGGLALNMNYSKEYPAAFLNFSDKDAWYCCPNDLLYWAAIRWAKVEGYKFFDMGGCSLRPRKREAGIVRFKRKWGQIFEYEQEVSKYYYIKRKLMNSCMLFYLINNILRNIRNKIKGVYNHGLD